MNPIPPMPDRGATPPMPMTTVRGIPLLPPQEAARGSQDRSSTQVKGGGFGFVAAGMETWCAAPATSHISRFALVTPNDKVNGVTVLKVGFKGPGGAGEVALYAYYAPSHEEGKRVFEKMSHDPHPYADVLVPDVKDAGWDYHPI